MDTCSKRYSFRQKNYAANILACCFSTWFQPPAQPSHYETDLPNLLSASYITVVEISLIPVPQNRAPENQNLRNRWLLSRADRRLISAIQNKAYLTQNRPLPRSPAETCSWTSGRRQTGPAWDCAVSLEKSLFTWSVLLYGESKKFPVVTLLPVFRKFMPVLIVTEVYKKESCFSDIIKSPLLRRSCRLSGDSRSFYTF